MQACFLRDHIEHEHKTTTSTTWPAFVAHDSPATFCFLCTRARSFYPQPSHASEASAATFIPVLR